MAGRLRHNASFDAGRKLRTRFMSFADGFRTPVPKPRTREIAVASVDIQNAAEFNMAYENPSDIVKKHGIATIDEMRCDETIHAVLTNIIKTRLRTDWSVQPHPDDPKDELGYAAECRQMFENLAGGLKNRLVEVYTALPYGFSVTERVVRWEPVRVGDRQFDGHVIVDLKTRKPHSFKFKLDPFGNLQHITQIDNSGAEHDHDPADFMHYAYDPEFGNPYGRSMLEPVYRPWVIKKWSVKWIASAGERFGNPTIIISTPQSYDPDRDKAQVDAVLKSWQSGTELTEPHEWKIRLEEPSGAGIQQLRENIKDMNFAIAVGLLMPEQGGYTQTDGGSYSKAEVQQKLWYGSVEDIGRDVEDLLTRECIAPYMAWNHPDAHELPYFEWAPLEEEDRKALMLAVIQAIRDVGLGVLGDWTKADINRLRDAFGLDELPKEFEPTGATTSAPDPSPDAQAGDDTAGGDQTGGADDEAAAPPPVQQQFADAFTAWPQHPAGARERAMKFADAKPGPSRRKLTQHEKHVNFADVDDRLNVIQTASMDRLVAVMFGARDDVIARLPKILGIGKNAPDERAIPDLRLKGMPEFRAVAREMLTMTALAGKGDVRTEAMAATGEKYKFADNSLYLVPANMRKFFKGLPLAASEKAHYGRLAFHITDVAEQSILAKVKSILYKAMETGDQQWAAKEIRRVFSDYLETGELKNEVLSTASRVETIVRTNMATAYNEGRKAMMEDPDVAPAIEAYQYTAILDNATTDYCAAMDGRVFDKGEIEAPPAHHNCRSFLVAVFRGEEFTMTTQANVRDEFRKASEADRKVPWREHPVNPDRIERATGF